ncbi:fumarate hydratase [Feifania hominis]|uniref:Fumarate hydratase n=1 Tax=Feifania hominis TaxID=2763660 RepID=A0A926HVA2_9FIRM|nr:fumarate hydratase [Feifania hominis]MBC8536780.1 fumarate hydratase [Feifania hominis]
MREVDVSTITRAVEMMCIEANMVLTDDIVGRIKSSIDEERSPLARSILEAYLENMQAAKDMKIPVCQDTGMAVIFLELGQEVHLVGGSLREAVDRGVSNGYTNGYLRCSVVGDPLRERVNTGDNTPAILHTEIVPGDRVKITVAPKGFGSENMSALRMMTPSATREDVVNFVVEAVERAGSNPCPPVVVGVGIGGDFELSALLAKRAITEPIDRPNPDPYYADMEREILERLNRTGIGPQGFGGVTTALGVNIRTYATHIAGLPVAVNIGCHVTRHRSMEL